MSEPKEKKIEKLELEEMHICNYGDTDKAIDILILSNKINELIDEIEKLKNE